MLIIKSASKKSIYSKDPKFATVFGEKTAYLNRHQTVFEQDLRYINREYQEYVVLHNLNTLSNDVTSIEAEFQKNYENYHSKKDKQVLIYHDKISFSPQERFHFLKNPQIALDLAQKWLQLRAPECL